MASPTRKFWVVESVEPRRGELRGADFPDGQSGFDYTWNYQNESSIVFAYEAQLPLFPYFDGANPTQNSPYAAGVALGAKRRGWVEVDIVGVEAWVAGFSSAIDSWIAGQITTRTGAGLEQTFRGQVVFDYESAHMFSYPHWNGPSNWSAATDPWVYYRNWRVSVSPSETETQTRNRWQALLTAWYLYMLTELRRRLPLARFSSWAQPMPHLTYDLDPLHSNNATAYPGTNRKKYEEVEYQLKSWMVALFAQQAYVEAEAFCVLGPLSPAGGTAYIAELDDTYSTSDPATHQYRWGQYVDMLSRVAAKSGKPVRAWMCPAYPFPNDPSTMVGLTKEDAEYLVRLLGQKGFTLGVWGTVAGLSTPNYDSFKRGLRNLNYALREVTSDVGNSGAPEES